jgi:ATP-dependent DNA helicase RecQ
MEFPFILRREQSRALQILLQNDHLIYIAPTGAGKSVIFQKYIFDRPSIRAVLISPLNALSRQQGERFKKIGIKVFDHQIPEQGEAGVWIMAPEKVQGRIWERVQNWSPEFLIIDEAHCVWEWGRKFRPAYRRILQLSEISSIKKTFWCSATMPHSFVRQLKNHLEKLPRSKIAQLGKFSLPSGLRLKIDQISPEKRSIWLRNQLELYSHLSGMIFCNTRASAMSLQKYLTHWGIRSIYYHAGLALEEKMNLEKLLIQWSKDRSPIVVVATSAFGMGMDYHFFRFCILFEPPFTLLSLVQAIGRVGRSSSDEKQPSYAHVLWHPDDFQRNRAWIDQTEVRNWCLSGHDPTVNLENYFNGSSLSGTMESDEFACDHSLRPEKIN